MVKEFALGLGLNPEEILIQNSFSEPDTKYVDPQKREKEAGNPHSNASHQGQTCASCLPQAENWQTLHWNR